MGVALVACTMNADHVPVAPHPPPAHHDDAERLLRAGAVLFGASLLNGFAIQAARLPRLALSAHLVGLFGAAFLMALAPVWTRLRLPPRTSRIGTVLAIYGFFAGWLLYLTAAVTGAAGLFPMAGAGERGTRAVEAVMSAALLTIALALFALAAMVWRHARGSRSAP